jgi:hypothetical protein
MYINAPQNTNVCHENSFLAHENEVDRLLVGRLDPIAARIFRIKSREFSPNARMSAGALGGLRSLLS